MKQSLFKTTTMNTDTPVQKPVQPITKEVSTQQLMNKLLELEKKLVLIEKKLTTPLIGGTGQAV
jgi:hypothetical protein